MTSFLPEGPDDIEEALCAWFAPLRRSSSTWETGDGLPFTIITHISGGEDVEVGYADLIVQVDTLVDKTLGWVNARNEATRSHQAMLELARNFDTIVLSGRMFSVDYIRVVETPRWLPFGDPGILRKMGRYQVGIEYVPISTS